MKVSQRTRKLLGWEPKGPGLIEDIDALQEVAALANRSRASHNLTKAS